VVSAQALPKMSYTTAIVRDVYRIGWMVKQYERDSEKPTISNSTEYGARSAKL